MIKIAKAFLLISFLTISSQDRCPFDSSNSPYLAIAFDVLFEDFQFQISISLQFLIIEFSFLQAKIIAKAKLSPPFEL